MKRGQLRAEERRRRRGDAFAVVGALLLGAVLAWIVLTVQQQGADLRRSNEARDALARQVQDLGGTPVAGKPGSRGDVGPSGPPGPRGRPGLPGPTGPPGEDGTDGKPGKMGKSGPSGSVGPTGGAGSAGQQGVPGEPGPAGPQGPQGLPGADGKDGRDGQTCPSSYYLQAPNWDPDALVCRRDDAPAPSPSPTSTSQPPAVLTPDRRRL